MKTIFNGVTTPMGPQILSQDATLSALGAGALGKSFVRLGNNPIIDPVVHYYPQTNSDGTVTLLTAAELGAVAGAGSGGGGDAFVALNLDQFAGVTQSAGTTLNITGTSKINQDVSTTGTVTFSNLTTGGFTHTGNSVAITNTGAWMSALGAAATNAPNTFSETNAFQEHVQFTKDIQALSKSKFSGGLEVLGVMSFTNCNVDVSTGSVLHVSGKMKVYDSTTYEFTTNGAANFRTALGASDGVYRGAADANVAVGGIYPGYVLNGKTFQRILQDMLVAYLPPEFTSFGIDGYTFGSVVEVGTPFDGQKTFRWGTSNPTNMPANSIRISYVYPDGSDITVATNLINDGSEALVASPPWGGPGYPFTTAHKRFRITGTQTQGPPFTRDFLLLAVFPIFYGKSTGTRPVASPALMNTGSSYLGDSAGNVLIPYSDLPTTPNDWHWFAIPDLGFNTNKTRWYVDALNNGVIGGEPSLEGDPDGNLFPADETDYFNSVLWQNQLYHIYISNYRTALANCEMRNS